MPHLGLDRLSQCPATPCEGAFRTCGGGRRGRTLWSPGEMHRGPRSLVAEHYSGFPCSGLGCSGFADVSLPIPKPGRTMMTVMSSICPAPSFCSCHRNCALFASFSAALWHLSDGNLATSCTAASGSMTSHMPSEQTRMMCSASSSRTTSSGTSGSEMTPAFLPSKSPMARDIARPPDGTTTRAGNLGPGLGTTCPPAAFIRASSSGRSGLWLSPHCLTSQVDSPGFFVP
mmetsp:Transcript_46434/g.137224  ORF Transcript_46434/g.137224 Transcript_46434/m.137224 type:complete len:230 (-) Transcript_46434:1071-1760(-)